MRAYPVLTEWTENLKERQVARNTLRDYRCKAGRFLDWLGDEKITRNAVVDYLRQLQGQGIRPRSLRGILAVLRVFIAWHHENGLLLEVSLANVRLPQNDAVRRHTPTDEEVSRIFAGIEKMPDHTLKFRFEKRRARAIFSIFAYTAVRRTECLSLDVNDLLDVRGERRIRIRHGKGGSYREIPVAVGGELDRVLNEWLEVRAEYLAEKGWSESALFINTGQRLDTKKRPLLRLGARGLLRLWKDVLSYAGLSESGIIRHSLRHWAATVIAADLDLATASSILGHTNIGTTIQYVHSNETERRRAVQSLEERVRNPTRRKTPRGQDDEPEDGGRIETPAPCQPRPPSHAQRMRQRQRTAR